MSAHSKPVGAPEITAAARTVRALRLPYLFIGGNALVTYGVGAGTYDIDVGVRRRDFEDVAERLRKLGWSVEIQGNAIGAFRDGEAIEFIHPGPFGPTDDPDAFFEHVFRNAADETEVGPTAKPYVVWYMRLCFEPETGRQKILQDIKLNMPEPEKVLDDALELARAMGREEQIRQHVAWVQARMQRAS